MAKIKLNGKTILIMSNCSIFRLLKRYKINENKVAVELNNKIIQKALYKSTNLKEKDRVEIVHFIGGG